MEPHNRVLLISNSTVYGRGYLDHVESEIKSFLGSVRRVLFFPFALHDRDAYTSTVRKRFGAMGYALESAHEAAVPQKAVAYVGSSAGSNVAGPTIKTTKDMPIVQPRAFNSLGLVPFQISPHYLDPDPNSTHMGETQEERILQFLEENDTPVVGIREEGWLLCNDGTVTLKGETAARIFRRGHAPVEATRGSEISNLVEGPNAI